MLAFNSALQQTVASNLIKCAYIHVLIYSLILQSKLSFKIPIMCVKNQKCQIKDPEVVELPGAVIQSIYKDVQCLCSEQTGQSQRCSV